jgi:hypothetical protein
VVAARHSWNLTVVGKDQLAFVAPHGRFPAKGLEAEVAEIVAVLPEGSEVMCVCAGPNVGDFTVLRVVGVTTDISARVMTLPDAIVTADPHLALARARHRIDRGEHAKAASDLGLALLGGEELALTAYERLPGEQQTALLDHLIGWQTSKQATWRGMRFIPLARWTIAHLYQAIAAAMTNGGVFGAAPGIEGEAILDELARRDERVAEWTKKLAKLRKARAKDGDTHFRITTELDKPEVIGSCAEGVYIAGSATIDSKRVNTGAHRYVAGVRQPVRILYAIDGSELNRLVGVEPIKDRFYVPEDNAIVHIDTADGRVSVERAPWRVEVFNHCVSNGWQVFHKSKKVFVAPAENDAVWVALELSKAAAAVALAPPWISFHGGSKQPFLFVALAEVMTAKEIRVDGKRFAKRAARAGIKGA